MTARSASAITAHGEIASSSSSGSCDGSGGVSGGRGSVELRDLDLARVTAEQSVSMTIQLAAVGTQRNWRRRVSSTPASTTAAMKRMAWTAVTARFPSRRLPPSRFSAPVIC